MKTKKITLSDQFKKKKNIVPIDIDQQISAVW